MVKKKILKERRGVIWVAHHHVDEGRLFSPLLVRRIEMLTTKEQATVTLEQIPRVCRIKKQDILVARLDRPKAACFQKSVARRLVSVPLLFRHVRTKREQSRRQLLHLFQVDVVQSIKIPRLAANRAVKVHSHPFSSSRVSRRHRLLWLPLNPSCPDAVPEFPERSTPTIPCATVLRRWTERSSASRFVTPTSS